MDGEVLKGIPAKAVNFNDNMNGEYEVCVVRGYNEDSEEYTVDFESSNKRDSVHIL